ncbi:MAG: formylglycine-generating enzyme family protein [Planctomycetota bacterium]|nr:formylglycine-generating enzyme family protein [Planctomycetota bacterium]
MDAFSRSIATNSRCYVLYKGTILIGEHKRQSKYLPGAFITPEKISLKNHSEIRDRAVSFLSVLESLNRYSGANRVVVIAEQDNVPETADLAQYAMDEPIGVFGGEYQDMLPTLQVETRLQALPHSADKSFHIASHKTHFVASKVKAGDKFVNSIGQIFCWCPAGSFEMGSAESEAGRGYDEDMISVDITKGFWISKYEVTEREYLAAMRRTSKMPAGKNYPFTAARHGDAKRFSDSLNKLEQAEKIIPAGWSYDLPTEAEWEYACRAETSTAYCFGDTSQTLFQFANFADAALFNEDPSGFRYADRNVQDGFARAAPVGHFLPNAWGIHDLHGNVSEWTKDTYAEQRPGGKDPLVTEKQFNERGNVIRGGSWLSAAAYCRSAMRNAQVDLNDTTHVGFRIVLRQNAL